MTVLGQQDLDDGPVSNIEEYTIFVKILGYLPTYILIYLLRRDEAHILSYPCMLRRAISNSPDFAVLLLLNPSVVHNKD